LNTSNRLTFIVILVIVLVVILISDNFVWNRAILTFIYCTDPSTDTLRYFFSSVFQGYAAIFALGGMFYIYNSDKIDTKLTKLEDKAEFMIQSYHLYSNNPLTDQLYITTHGVFQYVKDNIINEPNGKFKGYACYEYLEKSMLIHQLLRTSVKKVQKTQFHLMKLSIVFLFVSLFTLLFIQFNNTNVFNRIIFIIAEFFVLASLYYFYQLYIYISNCIGIFHFNVSDK